MAMATQNGNQNQPDKVEALQRRLGSVQLKEMKPRTRVPKRKMEPYEDAKNLIFQLLADPNADRSERIVRFKKEIASLQDHREPDMVYDRAIGLLELAVAKQIEKMGNEEAEAKKRGPEERAGGVKLK
jgi:hypothetical protein